MDWKLQQGGYTTVKASEYPVTSNKYSDRYY